MRLRGAHAALAVGLLFGGGCRRHSVATEEGAPAPADRGWKTPPFETADGGLVGQRLPRALYRGGPFLRHPRIVTVTFRGDDPAVIANVERFGDVITTTAWWRTVVDSYCAKDDDCIGTGSSGQHVRLDQRLPAELRDTDVDAVLEQAISDGRIDVTPKETLVLAYLPPGVTLADAYTPRYCNGGPRAFHRSLEVAKRRVAYAVLPRCGDESELTATASHELVEAVANPEPSRRGFAFESGALYQGFTAAGLEPVDPCGIITRDRHRVTESGFVVQRAWSNREASLGHQPCVPSRPGPYVALVPGLPTVRLQEEGDEVAIPLDAVADRTTSWSVSAVDLTGKQDGTDYVDVALDRTTVTSGDKGTLTIKLRKKNARQLDIVGLVSTESGTEHVWPVAVVLR